MTEEEWLDGHWSTRISSQQSRVDAAKLVVTFSAGVAVSATATMLGADPSMTSLSGCAVAATGLALFLALYVVLVSPLTETPVRGTLARAKARGLDQAGRLTALRRAVYKTLLYNESQLRAHYRFVGAQILLALSAAALATASLVSGG